MRGDGVGWDTTVVQLAFHLQSQLFYTVFVIIFFPMYFFLFIVIVVLLF